MQSDQESHSHHSDTIMDSWKLDYDDDVRENLEKDLPLKTGKTPNPEQWEMIKMRENNVCVCAGAGSGKTLSLIWRIVFLHAYLKVPLSNITVLSFTRKSVEEFREKLLEMLEKYDPNIDPALIDKTVRTFHSKILEFGRQSKFATTPDKMFEHLKAPEDVTESSYFSASEFRAENKSFTQLCQAISSAGYNVGVIGAPPDTIRWLNEILQVTDLLERMSTGWSKLSLTDEIKQLKRQSDNYRGEFFDKLYYNQQTVIKKLNRLLIELLYPDKVPAPINDSDDDEIVDHIFNRTRIPIEQSRILKDIYRHLFQNDPQFKELINRLYVSFLTKSNLYDSAKYTERERQDRILDAYSRDTRLSEVVHDMINGKYKSKKIKKFYLNNVDKPICFYANGYVKELSLYIVFIPDKKTLGYYASEEFDGQLSLKACLTIKDKLLHSGSDKDIRIIHNQQEMNIFEEKINSCLSDLASGNAPSFQFALTGDLIADDIWKVLFKAGVFIENSGLSVETIAGCINDPELDEHDRKFLRALIIFWRQLNETLRNSEKPLYRYHDLFEAFSEENIIKFKEWIDPGTALTMKYLLIDEFQDVSPEIAKWIKGIIKYLNNTGEQPSLMCIGDDWQSIYGWRGSSPYYIIKYQDEFPTNPPAEVIKLVENWRSYQDLLDRAATVLEDIDSDRKSDKRVECKKGPNPAEESTLELISGEDHEEICDKVKEILKKVTQNEKIYILCRNQTSRKALAESLKRMQVKVLTFHGSKGLEADYCILVGDCVYKTSSPFKNMIYRMNGSTDKYNLTYDSAQRDETKRLAYVALTRAEKKCYWFAKQQFGGCFSTLQGTEPLDLVDLEPF